MEYNTHDMTYRKWSWSMIYHFVQLVTAQLYVLDITSCRLLLKTVSGTFSLPVLRHDVESDEGSIEAVEQYCLFAVF